MPPSLRPAVWWNERRRLYANQGNTAPCAARCHRFRTIVHDQPFHQARDDDTQTLFRILLSGPSNCQATEDDWWLQTRRPTCLLKKMHTLTRGNRRHE